MSNPPLWLSFPVGGIILGLLFIRSGIVRRDTDVLMEGICGVAMFVHVVGWYVAGQIALPEGLAEGIVSALSGWMLLWLIAMWMRIQYMLQENHAGLSAERG